MANFGISMTSRAVSRQKRRMSNAHEEYVDGSLVNYLEKALVLNVDDYHNIHTPQQPDMTTTSFATNMTTIVVNPCQLSLIPHYGAINPKIVDDELITKHLNERFIVNLGVPYYDQKRDSQKVCSDEELIEQLTVHSYNDRIENKTNNQHIWDAILFDFIKNDLKGVSEYINALQIVYNQELMQEYLFNNAVPVVANWPGQFYIRKTIAHRIIFYLTMFIKACLEQKKSLDLLNNLILLALDVYAVHHREEFKKKLDKKEPDVTDIGTENENDSDNADEEVDNVPEDLLELENAKESFLKF
ncbi:hypothetical protein C2G38_2136600 [Gigaspora rosea]|uniref:Uncharacterized protein n=1 Tax=Gigaspora rosea TaxID=44941 RepID=A0A397W5B4_9GLOM|nr:hypothetical protein C2G38_2136600 [Gigaspora rosea]